MENPSDGRITVALVASVGLLEVPAWPLGLLGGARAIAVVPPVVPPGGSAPLAPAAPPRLSAERDIPGFRGGRQFPGQQTSDAQPWRPANLLCVIIRFSKARSSSMSNPWISLIRSGSDSM